MNTTVLFSILFVISIIIGSILLLLFIVFPAKQSEDLNLKRKIGIGIVGVLFFVMTLSGGVLSYDMLVGRPTLGIVMIIFLVSLIVGIYQGGKLYLLQYGSIESYQLINRFREIKDNKDKMMFYLKSKDDK
jgi:hypothetical protein